MSWLSRRLRTGLLVGAVATSATLAVVVPGGDAAAASRPQTVRHATLNSVLSRLPNYFPDIVHWKVSTSWRHYGTTNWDTNTITISAFTPLNLLYSVVAHEWSHEIQAYDYHRDFWGLVQAMNRHFGGAGSSGQRGVEYAADCMAVIEGATWTDYTSCQNKQWRHDAKRLLAGKRLKSHHHHHHHSSAGTTAYPIADPAQKPAGHKPGHKPAGHKPSKPQPAPTTVPEPEPYPAPPAYTINWGPTFGR